MSIKWSVLRDYIRTTILKDIPALTNNGSEDTATEQFSDEQLLICARWACVSLSMHTAQTATHIITCDGSNQNQWQLPDDIVDGIEKAALVIYDNGTRLYYLTPTRLSPGLNWPDTAYPAGGEPGGYWEWPSGTLVTDFFPSVGTHIVIRYFKVWTPPSEDDSILGFPMQFEQPFAYLVGASAFDPLGAQASVIRTWNQKTDSGTPEDNTLQKQSLYFLAMADRRLKDIGIQDRETFYSKESRDPSWNG